MTKKQYYAILDSETTIKDRVADLGIIIVDRRGEIASQCGILIKDIFGVEDLFYDKSAEGIWARASISRRMDAYHAMLESGSRMLASVNAVNRWIDKAIGKYNPVLTAYNLAFDNGKCLNTGIDLTGFKDRFCLWGAASGIICKTKGYRQFVLERHLFNPPTQKGNMTYSTTAETVTGYLQGELTDEPHTALEDAIGWELPILKKVLATKGWRDKIEPYNWRHYQVKEHFKAG